MDPDEPHNSAQVNIPLPDGHTVVNYAVVLITDHKSVLLHSIKDASGEIDALNALDVLIEGLNSCETALKKKYAERTLIHRVPAGMVRIQ